MVRNILLRDNVANGLKFGDISGSEMSLCFATLG